MQSLQDLPAELLVEVLEKVETSDLASLRLASKTLHAYVGGASIRLRTNNPDFDNSLLPQLAAAFPQAIALDTNDNQNISSLEGIGALVNLKTLRVSDASSLRTIPKEIGSLTALEILDLDGNPELEDLPEEIGDLANLRVLILDGCFTLSCLPDSITKLSGLQELHMKGIAEVKLPADIGEMRGLKLLVLGDCDDLPDLPEDIRRLVGLEELRVTQCPLLESLSDELGELVGLKALILDGNHDLLSIPCIGACRSCTLSPWQDADPWPASREGSVISRG